MLIIVAWLSLVERCVRDAEVASSNLVATTKNTPSHMCEGVFLFLQLFKLTTSNWFGHTVRAQRAHEVQWTSALSRPKRSGDPRGPGDLGLDRPERSGDRKFNFRWFNRWLNATHSLQFPLLQTPSKYSSPVEN